MKTNLNHFIIYVIITCAFCSCQNVPQNYIESNPGLDTKKIIAIKTGQVVNGMDQKEVKIILGDPTFEENMKDQGMRWIYRLVEKGKPLSDVYTPESGFPQGIAYIIPFYYRPVEIRIDFCNNIVCRVNEILSF